MPVDLRPRDGSDGPMCVNHGSACAMGTRELPELYRMVVEAKQATGQDVPPLDEHRRMTGKERKQYLREIDDLVAGIKAQNDQTEMELRAERSTLYQQGEPA